MIMSWTYTLTYIILGDEKKLISRQTYDPLIVLIDLYFADDIAFLSSTFQNTQNLFENLLREAQFVGLSLNVDKNKYLLGGQWKTPKRGSYL